VETNPSAPIYTMIGHFATSSPPIARRSFMQSSPSIPFHSATLSDRPILPSVPPSHCPTMHVSYQRRSHSQELAKLGLEDTVRDKLPLLGDLGSGGHVARCEDLT
jgi:hypothetical protein